MGAGKTYAATKLAALLDYPVFDTDRMIEVAAGTTISAIFAGEEGEAAFRQMEHDLLRHTDWPEAAIISCGGGMPCFSGNMDFMLAMGRVVWLTPDMDTLVQRLWQEKNHRPLVAMAASPDELRQKLQDLLEQRRPFYERAHLHAGAGYRWEDLAASLR